MRKVRSIVSILLAVLILLCGATVVCAEESETDWAKYDWENYTNPALSDQEWGAACKWFRAEADVEILFSVKMKTDGYRSEGLSGILSDRFMEDPIGFITALSLEEEKVRTHIVSSVVFGARVPAELGLLLNNLTLPEDAGPVAMDILVRLVNDAEESWRLDITNPHTGDSVGIAALLMVFSGLGGSILWKKRKIVA